MAAVILQLTWMIQMSTWISPCVLAASLKNVRSVHAVKCLIAGDLLRGKKHCKYASFLPDPLADGTSF